MAQHEKVRLSLSLPKPMTDALKEYADANSVTFSKAAGDLISRGMRDVALLERGIDICGHIRLNEKHSGEYFQIETADVDIPAKLPSFEKRKLDTSLDEEIVLSGS